MPSDDENKDNSPIRDIHQGEEEVVVSNSDTDSLDGDPRARRCKSGG